MFQRSFGYSVGTVIVLMGCLAAIVAVTPREKPYADLSPALRLIHQGLDYLDVDVNTPFDCDSAVERFASACAAEAATREEVVTADFLRCWAEWVRPTVDFEEVRRGLRNHLEKYPDSPYRLESHYILGLVELHDPFHGDATRAVEHLTEVYKTGRDSFLVPLAATALPGIYLHLLRDPEQAAHWYGVAFDATVDTHTTDERLGFLYVQAKLYQQLGKTNAAKEIYRRILDLTRNGTNTWTPRVLDRLDELGEHLGDQYFKGLDTTPLPVTDHHFVSEKPLELSVSFWILEKPGMRRGIETIARNYEARSSGVKIRLIDLPYRGYHDWLQSQILGQEIPDIVMIDNGTAIRYGAQQGKLVDMTPFLEEVNPYTGMRWADMYYPQFILNARDPVYRRNWIISWASENTACFYNKDAFRKAGIIKRHEDGTPVLGRDGKPEVAEPKTWRELMAAFEALRKVGIYGEVVNFHPDPAPIIWQLPYYRKQLYFDLIPTFDTYTPDDYPDAFEIAEALLRGTMDLRNPSLAEPWRLLYEKSEYWMPGASAMDIQQGFEAFASGRAATLFWVSTDMSSFEEMCNFDLGVFPFPLLVDSPYYDGEYSEEFSLSAFECSVPLATRARGNLDAAVDFLRYFTSPEAQEILSREAVCMSPIRGVRAPEKLEPFLRRMNRRGTFLFYFDPYALSIGHEPYWSDARDKLWSELTNLLGSIPNYDYYRRLTGGTEAEYQEWRKSRFDQFLEGLQKYFGFAYNRLIREYSLHTRRELKRTQNRWIHLFRQRYTALPGDGSVDSAMLEKQIGECWRSVTDNWDVITRCERMLPPEEQRARYTNRTISYQEQKQIARLLKIALILLIGLGALLFMWSGALLRVVRDWGYIRVLLPTAVLLALFSYTPALSAIYHSFFRWDGGAVSEFVGLENFRSLFHDEVLFQSVKVLGVFLVANLLKFVPTLVVAVVLFHLASARLQYAFRVIYVLPMAIPGMVGILIWKYFYRMDGGVLNWLLLNLGVIRAPINWLGTEETVVPALIFLGFPWVSTIGVLILLAGLQSIDPSVFEAALLDGCGVFRRFRTIELPLIMGQVKLNVVLVTLGTIQDFGLPLVLTRGGPNNASMLPGLWMYLSAFSHGKMGYAAALGVVMFLVMLSLTYINMRMIKTDQAN